MVERQKFDIDELPFKPVEFMGEEYPAHFIIWNWVREMVKNGETESLEGRQIGEANTVHPGQVLIWENGSVIARSKKTIKRQTGA